MLLSQVPVPSLPLHRFHPNARMTIMPMVPSLPLHRFHPNARVTIMPMVPSHPLQMISPLCKSDDNADGSVSALA